MRHPGNPPLVEHPESSPFTLRAKSRSNKAYGSRFHEYVYAPLEQ